MEKAIQNVVRVGVANNFYCTKPEWEQLDQYAAKLPHRYFFINCNIKTPSLITINNHPYKAVITINPDLVIMEKLHLKLTEIDPEKIAFVRLKWLPEDNSHINLLEDLVEEYTVGITPQRFKNKLTIPKFTSPEFYKQDHCWWRLAGPARQALEDLVDSPRFKDRTFICDRAGRGCPACGRCATQTFGEDLPVYSLNLSSSGGCDFNCVDCFAKFNAIRSGGKVAFDRIEQNNKQLGKAVHG